jgi:tetratricopeptide (TPR) repeat protein
MPDAIEQESKTLRQGAPRTSSPSGLPRLNLVVVAIAAVLAITAAYYNSVNNGFHLDDQYGLILNPWIRSLRNIPRYFVDPFTLTIHGANADYRPVLQATYALNYAISKYKPWSWHLLNLLLHAWVTVNVFALGRILLGRKRILPLAWLSEPEGDVVACAATLLFAVHPITTGIANYMWARSSLLVAVFVLPATVLYLRALRDGSTFKGVLLPALLYGLALFTKVEAISLLGVLYLAELLFCRQAEKLSRQQRRYQNRKAEGNGGWSWSALLPTSAGWARLVPFLAVALVYFGIRFIGLPRFNLWGVGVGTPKMYLLTQFRAWWYYIGEFFAPVWMVADYGSYPMSTSVLDPRVLYAVSGWVCVLALLLYAARRAPAITFLGLAFFVHLSPTSSFVPLSEMVNEHRPYLPLVGIFLIAALGLFVLLRQLSLKPWVYAVVVLLFMVPLAGLTHARNQVWVDEITLWADTVAKNPESARAQMNYGVELMSRAEYEGAERRFREAVRLAPFWNLAHINLAIDLAARGDLAEARRQYDEAVRVAPNDSAGYYWRGLFFSKQGDTAGAIEDLKIAVERSTVPSRELQALADNLLRAGRLQEAAAAIQRGAAIDPQGFQPLRQRLAAMGK